MLRLLSILFLLGALIPVGTPLPAEAASTTITLIGSTGSPVTSSTTIALATPTNTVTGDTGVAVILAEGNHTISMAPSGWALQETDTLLDSHAATQAVMWTYTRTFPSTPAASYTWTFNSSTTAKGLFNSYRNVDSVNPFGIVASDKASVVRWNPSDGVAGSSISTHVNTGNSCVLLLYGGLFNQTPTMSLPSGWTTEGSQISSTSGLVGADHFPSGSNCDSAPNTLANVSGTWSKTPKGTITDALILHPAGAPWIGSDSTSSTDASTSESVPAGQATAYQFVADGTPSSTSFPMNTLSVYVNGANSSSATVAVMTDLSNVPSGTEMGGECTIPSAGSAGWASCLFPSDFNLVDGNLYWLAFLDTGSTFPVKEAPVVNNGANREWYLASQTSMPTDWSAGTSRASDTAVMYLSFTPRPTCTSTCLVGNSSQNVVLNNDRTGGSASTYNLGAVASTAAGTATTFHAYLDGSRCSLKQDGCGTTYTLALYDNSANLMDSCTFSYNATTGWFSCSLTGSKSIASGTTYVLTLWPPNLSNPNTFAQGFVSNGGTIKYADDVDDGSIAPSSMSCYYPTEQLSCEEGGLGSLDQQSATGVWSMYITSD
jgi:hypothetical protein